MVDYRWCAHVILLLHSHILVHALMHSVYVAVRCTIRAPLHMCVAPRCHRLRHGPRVWCVLARARHMLLNLARGVLEVDGRYVIVVVVPVE